MPAVPTGSASFRDPENAAFFHEGTWYRIAGPASAQALTQLHGSPLYGALVSERSILSYEIVDAELAPKVLHAYATKSGRRPPSAAVVFRVETAPLITYPWEWPNSLLEAAAKLTLSLRMQLLEVGLDLKDASAFNVQFVGMKAVFIDIGSIEMWRPNPSWNASRQFIENFINPLAVGSGEQVTAADAWELSRYRGLKSSAARQLLPRSKRRSFSLRLLQATTRPVAANAPSETEFAERAARNKDLALKATQGLTRRLLKQVTKLHGTAHRTTWVDYSTREHYGSDDLVRKSDFAADFVKAAPGRGELVLDVGGNDGFTAAHLVRNANANVVVLDADAGALDVLHAGISATPDLVGRVTPILGDITNLMPAAGLLDAEFAAFTERVHPTAITCQAVLHHVVITQGTPMGFAVDALARFGAPVQIEFASEDDAKVKVLLAQIPNWQGEYSTEALLEALRARFVDVEVVGTTSPTRVVVNAWNQLDLQ
ncbi:MAG: hypothetical protein F2763_05590 [Actinobacteria bacterium]|uniref:Unannotated protein n=1 Tax=freshwater metagenome TaxID=449393 RepID=A0A6J7AJE7_9ZZZZ|nr:hypothetical protein [Actinomycetota bacterium]